jgi:uncharacterized protein (TIGR03085 family)
LARAERAGLADVLREVGPVAPTLCAGWVARDLAAHLVTRERVPQAAPGLVIPRLHGITERAEQATARAHTFSELVERFRHGPPWWNPVRLGLFDDATNFVEFFVHHEDVRRASPDLPRREPQPPVRDRLWSTLRLAGAVRLLRARAGVVAERTDAPGRITLHRGSPELVIIGAPEDILLYVYGRREAARVDVRGDADALGGLCTAGDDARGPARRDA